MPLTPDDQAKLNQLKTIADPIVSELVAVRWPAPDGTIYYTSTALDEALGPRGLNIEIRFNGNQFLDIAQDSGISDDKVDLDFWDGDDELTRLFHTHGAGAKVEIFYYFPEVDLLLLQWWGHLQPPTDSPLDRFKTSAEFGFMSSLLPLPRRALMYTSCQAMFGGLLKTQEEIDEGDCPYNRHLTATSLAAFDPVHVVNCNTSGGGCTKNAGGSAWNAGASHSQVINEGDDVVIELTLGPATGVAGFAMTASPVNGNTDFKFGLQRNPGGDITMRGEDSAHSYANATTGTTGDVFRIVLRGGTFHLYKGSTEIVLQSFTPPLPVYPLYIGVAIFTVGAGFTAISVKVGGDIGTGPSFGLLNPDTGLPFTSCPRNTRAACTARLGDSLSYLAGDTIVESHVVGQTKGPAITVTSRGNESTLKRPLRVIAGTRHVADMDLMAFTIEPDTKHPEGGAVQVLFAVSEGPLKSLTNLTVNGNLVGAQHLNVRLGLKRQSKTGFSTNVNNYSSTALFYARVQGDFTKATANDLKAEGDVEGNTDVRVYSDATHFVEQYTADRAWWLGHVMRKKRWGWGLDLRRIYIPDLIALSAWWAETVTVTDKDGNTTTGPRSTFHAELIDRTAQQQISDICQAGRCSLPFPDDSGQVRVVPLKKVADLTTAPLFTDRGEDRNICVQNGASTLTRTELSDKDLPNRVVVTYDDASNKNTQVPLTFEDIDQQLASGRAFGDFTQHAVEKPYTAFGVTTIGEAGRLGNLLLDLGEFDEGGLKNNLRVQFTTWWVFAVELQKYQVIKVESDKLDFINAIRVDQGLEPFNYFRVRTKRRMSDLKVEISAQAYPVEYYERLESAVLPPPIVPAFPLINPGGGNGRLPFVIGFDTLEHTVDRINVKLLRLEP